MLNKEQYERLLDDLKLIAKASKVVCDENDQIKRQYAFSLLSDLVDRLYTDISIAHNPKSEQTKISDLTKER